MIGRCVFCVKLFFKLLHVIIQQVYGSWRIYNLAQPIVTIFGGARFGQMDIYAQQAMQLASMLVSKNISVLTGGGPGIMEAANCGAVQTSRGKTHSIGVGVRGLGEGKNMCVKEYFELDYFYARKWLLTNYSQDLCK